ncbi:MAG: hypothetical protein KGZ40_07460 [Clostridiales bacterium]|nr:hypothetical protein [Clostridiales bacterium]
MNRLIDTGFPVPLPGSSEPSAYRGTRVALLTQHGKERVIAPVLASALHCHIELVEGFDTDRLGTFTRDVPRDGTQIEAARKKARIGMELSGMSHGLASEGSFGPDPFTGLLPWNTEVIVFLDDVLGIEVIGSARGHAVSAHRVVVGWEEIEAFARSVDFPAHQLVVRPEDSEDPRILKGVTDWAALKAGHSWAARLSADGRVFVEVDLRAHANPTRMAVIRSAAEDLAARLVSVCPECGAPGFGTVERVAGLPCSECGAPTRETKAEVWACVRCAHRIVRDRPGHSYADAGVCDHCNP